MSSSAVCDFSIEYNEFDRVIEDTLLSAIPRSVQTTVRQIDELSSVSRFNQVYCEELTVNVGGEFLGVDITMPPDAYAHYDNAEEIDNTEYVRYPVDVAVVDRRWNPLAVKVVHHDQWECPLPTTIAKVITGNHTNLEVHFFFVTLESLKLLIPPTITTLILMDIVLDDDFDYDEFLVTIKNVRELELCFLNWRIENIDFRSLLADPNGIQSMKLWNVTADLDEDVIELLCKFNGQLTIVFNDPLSASTARRLYEYGYSMSYVQGGRVLLESPDPMEF